MNMLKAVLTGGMALCGYQSYKSYNRWYEEENAKLTLEEEEKYESEDGLLHGKRYGWVLGVQLSPRKRPTTNKILQYLNEIV